MSSFVRRMQPDEALVPMVHGSLVPWMRYSVSLLPEYKVHGPRSDRIVGTAFPLCSCGSKIRLQRHNIHVFGLKPLHGSRL